MSDENCCCDQKMTAGSPGKKKTVRSGETKKKLVCRLNRIAGQINGISRMIENDAYCVDVLTQTAAAQSALKGFSREIIDRHIRSCVADSVRSGDNSVIDELVDTLYKFIK